MIEITFLSVSMLHLGVFSVGHSCCFPEETKLRLTSFLSSFLLFFLKVWLQSGIHTWGWRGEGCLRCFPGGNQTEVEILSAYFVYFFQKKILFLRFQSGILGEVEEGGEWGGGWGGGGGVSALLSRRNVSCDRALSLSVFPSSVPSVFHSFFFFFFFFLLSFFLISAPCGTF